MNKYSLLNSFAVLSAIGLTHSVQAANNDDCSRTTKPNCYSTSDSCDCTYCLGPTNSAVNAAVRPRTCNGDFTVTVAGFYWNAHQERLTYAVENQVSVPQDNPLSNLEQIGYLNNAKFKNPNFKWNPGFKLGLGWNSECDGWDFGAVWTWYKGSASSHDETEADDNRVLLPIWSDYFGFPAALPLFARDIETKWNLQLNLVDISLGREFWTSQYLTFRPFIGLRYARIDQEFHIQHKGGTWSNISDGMSIGSALNNFVDLGNDFHGTGVRLGFDSVWNFGCGWALYGDLAASIVYGRFKISHNEYNRLAVSPFAKETVLDSETGFRLSAVMLDLELGVQWRRMFCECKYGFQLKFGWEQHLFFNQNQLWAVMRTYGANVIPPPVYGENNYMKRRGGDLSTQGWTLTLGFEF